MKILVKVLPVLLAFAAGCSATSTRPEAASREPVGCCCTYGDCREKLTQRQCVSEAEFQEWTYTWHAGPCTKSDAPAPG